MPAYFLVYSRDIIAVLSLAGAGCNQAIVVLLKYLYFVLSPLLDAILAHTLSSMDNRASSLTPRWCPMALLTSSLKPMKELRNPDIVWLMDSSVSPPCDAHGAIWDRNKTFLSRKSSWAAVTFTVYLVFSHRPPPPFSQALKWPIERPSGGKFGGFF